MKRFLLRLMLSLGVLVLLALAFVFYKFLTLPPVTGSEPAWSSDGSVYFISNRSGNENIWAVGMNGSSFTPNSTDSGIVNVDRDDRPPFDP